MIVTVIVIFFMKDDITTLKPNKFSNIFMYVAEFIRLNIKQFYRNYYNSTTKFNGSNRKIVQLGIKRNNK